ncbi:hypothetical protein A9Q91_03130 [Candidatus Gracilibacteria bacterium 28_42_T64]|nr:hypothetical protein A9Q91_03130 [Candidatus Gracilibacteria bacterium 28_42_T64]
MLHKSVLLMFLLIAIYILASCGGGNPGPPDPLPEPEYNNENQDTVGDDLEELSKSPISFYDLNIDDEKYWESQFDIGYILTAEIPLDITLELSGNTKLCFSVDYLSDVDDCDEIQLQTKGQLGDLDITVTIDSVAQNYENNSVIYIEEDSFVHIQAYSLKEILLKTQFVFNIK